MVVKRRTVNFVAETFVWTVLGCFVEVLVTATLERLSLGARYVLAGVPWASLQGHTTMWTVVDGVALTACLQVLIRWFRGHRMLHRWWGRGIITMLLIYTCELLGGLLFNKLLGFALWDYSQYVWHGVPLHLLGQITLVYAPFWFLAGVFLPAVYRAVHAVTPYVGTEVVRFLEDIERNIDRAARVAPTSSMPSGARSRRGVRYHGCVPYTWNSHSE